MRIWNGYRGAYGALHLETPDIRTCLEKAESRAGQEAHHSTLPIPIEKAASIKLTALLFEITSATGCSTPASHFAKSLGPLCEGRDFLTATEAAKLIGVGRSHFYAMHSSGRLGPMPISLGRRTLWKRKELENWVSADCPPRGQWKTGSQKMRVFKTSYKARDGKTKKARKWYIELRDHLLIVRRVPAFTDKGQSEALGRQIERLVNYKVAGERPDVQLSRWLEGISKKLRDRIVKISLLDRTRASAGKPLLEHLEDFRESLLAKGDTLKQANQVVSRARRIVAGCKFKTWTDLSASKVERYLVKLRNDGDGMSAQTSNFYLQAVQQFCRWMVQNRRATESPLAHLKGLNVRTDRRHDRRALEPDEMRRLLEATVKAPKRFGMSGYERSLLYRFAAESGLRANEIRSLTIGSFDFSKTTVSVKAGYSKRRRQDTTPLRPDTAAEFKSYFKNKHPNTKVFGGDL